MQRARPLRGAQRVRRLDATYHPFRHLGLKILAIALASLLWLTVAGEHVVERSLRVPLEFRNIPEALEIVGNAPDSVDVRLRGSSAVLEPAPAGRDRRGARPGDGAAGLAALSHPQRRGPRAVRRRGGAGRAVHAGARAREVGAPRRPGRPGDRGGSRARVRRWAASRRTRPRSRSSGPIPASGRSPRRRPSRSSLTGAAARVRDGVTVGVVDSSVRLDSAAERRP